jgi:hypothetical protein
MMLTFRSSCSDIKADVYVYKLNLFDLLRLGKKERKKRGKFRPFLIPSSSRVNSQQVQLTTKIFWTTVDFKLSLSYK